MKDILLNIITFSFIIGIATFIIQRLINKRFNKIEEFQKILIAVRKEKYDTLLKTLQEIWEKVIEMEYYIRHDLNKQIEVAIQNQQSHLEFDFLPLRNAFIFIEKRSLLLTTELSCQVRNFLVNYFQKTYNGYIQVLNETLKGEKTIDDVNSFIPTALGMEYKNELEKLRYEFENQARKILYDNNM